VGAGYVELLEILVHERDPHANLLQMIYGYMESERDRLYTSFFNEEEGVEFTVCYAHPSFVGLDDVDEVNRQCMQIQEVKTKVNNFMDSLGNDTREEERMAKQSAVRVDVQPVKQRFVSSLKGSSSRVAEPQGSTPSSERGFVGNSQSNQEQRPKDRVFSRADLSGGTQRTSHAQFQRVDQSWKHHHESPSTFSRAALEAQNTRMGSGKPGMNFAGQMRYKPRSYPENATPDFRPSEHSSSKFSNSSMQSAYMKSPSYRGAESEVEEVKEPVVKPKKPKKTGSKGSKGAMSAATKGENSSASKGVHKPNIRDISLADKRLLLQEDEEFLTDSEDEREQVKKFNEASCFIKQWRRRG
jgi:hypothetical protein